MNKLSEEFIITIREFEELNLETISVCKIKVERLEGERERERERRREIDTERQRQGDGDANGNRSKVSLLNKNLKLENFIIKTISKTAIPKHQRQVSHRV